MLFLCMALLKRIASCFFVFFFVGGAVAVVGQVFPDPSSENKYPMKFMHWSLMCRKISSIHGDADIVNAYVTCTYMHVYMYTHTLKPGVLIQQRHQRHMCHACHLPRFWIFTIRCRTVGDGKWRQLIFEMWMPICKKIQGSHMGVHGSLRVTLLV